MRMPRPGSLRLESQCLFTESHGFGKLALVQGIIQPVLCVKITYLHLPQFYRGYIQQPEALHSNGDIF